MNRFLLGGLAALVMAGVGLFWWQGRAEVEKAAPPPEAMASFDPEELPSADPGEIMGPEPPAATKLTREQRRFGRYDRNSDGRISRNEMLSTRTAAFRKLDKDGNNLLSFEEWAVTTVDKFDHADVNRDDELTPEEFARTAPPPRRKPKCGC
ncbi:EF-hand domain-containing protein [Novosphingobium beihaiensis]|uniref:EF-hand domain-containing protein n=1 Tax=Novosphingobium beihaiensis TaxID=2930389 RepID=A0ABT0BMM7_9SPHN|nr:EF-hand domain-containing protein [Novosphingobium beihaiensis]MCJ2186306.1 EF-hand domain-containing protein [Novosphingobium beihaiensis]